MTSTYYIYGDSTPSGDRRPLHEADCGVAGGMPHDPALCGNKDLCDEAMAEGYALVGLECHKAGFDAGYAQGEAAAAPLGHHSEVGYPFHDPSDGAGWVYDGKGRGWNLAFIDPFLAEILRNALPEVTIAPPFVEVKRGTSDVRYSNTPHSLWIGGKMITMLDEHQASQAESAIAAFEALQ